MFFKDMIFGGIKPLADKYAKLYRKNLAKYIASLCDDSSTILDVGCHNGHTAKMIMDINPSLHITGVDIQSNQKSEIPRKIYDGKKIPYSDEKFDIVMALDVLHHTSDIPSLFKEMKRVAKKYIIIKDHRIHSTFSKSWISISDYLLNAPYGIKCTFNYPSNDLWHKYFRQLNLNIIAEPKNLNFGFTVDERYNPIFKLEK